MTLKQRSNLARTAVFMLRNNYVLDMNTYFRSHTGQMHDPFDETPSLKDYKHCGTTCCFAGHGPIALKNRKPHETWQDYIDRTFTGEDYDGGVFNFLFSGNWPNNKKQAAARALTYLRDEDTALNDFEYTEIFLKSYSAPKLIRELEKII